MPVGRDNGGVRERRGYLLEAWEVVIEVDFEDAFEARASRSIRRPSAIKRCRSSLARFLPVLFVSSCVLRLRGAALFGDGTASFGAAALESTDGLSALGSFCFEGGADLGFSGAAFRTSAVESRTGGEASTPSVWVVDGTTNLVVEVATRVPAADFACADGFAADAAASSIAIAVDCPFALLPRMLEEVLTILSDRILLP